MKHSRFTRWLSMFLAVVMIIGCMPMTASAYDETFVSETHEVYSRTTSTIAPGVTQDICYAYAKDGNQMVYYVATADITRDDVDVYANYKDNQCAEFGMQKLTEQMAAAQAKHSNPEDTENYIEYYNVVAGVNADFYNMTTGQPSGAFVMEGTVVNSSNNRPFFAILENGKAVIGSGTTDWNTYSAESPVMEAVGGSQVLVKDGVDVTASASGSYNTDRHSRTCVGVTADGEVVMMVLDGRQVPFSCGGSMHELAQIMLEAGCVAAINLDGGGSTTFAARQEGENEVTIVNRPSDGSERSISSSLMIVSTAIPSDVFDRAVLTAENTYVTPGSTVNVSATGVSPAGTAAEIPADVTWQLKDASLGTVENGVFTSNGTAGDAVVQMVYNGAVVGETTIHVVIPEAIKFNSEAITVPYSKTIQFDITATYGLNKVVLKDGDVNFTLSDDMVGTVDGYNFTACEESTGLTGCSVTATLAYNASVTCSGTITLGKGSEVIQDFESGVPSNYTITTTYPQYGPMGSKKDANGNYYYNGQNEIGKIYAVTAETGKVRNGSQAMAVECDYSQIYETGWHGLNLRGWNFSVDASAQAIGVWVYMPELEDLYATSVRFLGTTTSGTSVAADLWDTGYNYAAANDGWQYFSFDLSAVKEAITFNTMQLYINDRDGSSHGYAFKDNSSVNGKFTYYLDDVTIDYSSAVDDREEPVFEYVRASYGGLSDAVDVKGQTIDSNVVSVTAKASDDTTKTNATGLDIATAKAYIDGVEVTSGFSCTDAGVMTIDDVALADGTHTFKFEICDKMGNLSFIERQLTVAASSDLTTVAVVPADATADKLLIGSLYWMNITTSAIEDIQSITTELNLNSVSTWELDHMEVAEGFEASYTVDEITNNATITITRTGKNGTTGEAVLAQLPIRTWVSRLTEYEGYEASTPAALWSRKIIWPMDIKLEANLGSVVFTDATVSSFSMAPLAVDTELYGNYAELNANGDYSNKTSWHVHTAEAMTDVAATCTEDGYTGRTFCETCNSVVDWGTTISATGHTYAVVDGVLKCEDCGDLYNGEYEGKLYADGVAVEGWIEDSYYVDGVKLTGVKAVDGYYYDFGDNGVCAGKVKYTGLFYDETIGKYRYAQLGELSYGWKTINNEWYYFFQGNLAAASGELIYGDVTYTMDETGRLTSGVWRETEEGMMYYYGPYYYYKCWATIDGEEYYFGENGCRYEGYNIVKDSWTNPMQWYQFTDEGVLVEKLTMTGLLEVNGKIYYLVDGISQYGLYYIDGYYYYFNSSYAAVTGKYYINQTNGLLPQAEYEFAEDGKMIIEEATKDGIVEEADGLYYYEDGVKVYAGLIQIDGAYYYVNSKYKVVTGTYYVNKTNGLLPQAEYQFDENGKMIVEEEDVVKDGIVEENGALYYYVNGVKVYAGLIQIDGDYYYVNSSCKVVTGTYYVYKTNDMLPQAEYQFAEDGKMIVEEATKDGIVEEDGTLYYYVNGVKVYAGLIQIDGAYYYVNSSCKVVTGTYYVYKTNDLLPQAEYQFDENGKMITEDAVKDGIVEEEDGLYYYENGVKVYAGLIQIDGDYYYVNSKYKVVTGIYYVYKTNDLLPQAEYEFGEDGKMIQ